MTANYQTNLGNNCVCWDATRKRGAALRRATRLDTSLAEAQHNPVSR